MDQSAGVVALDSDDACTEALGLFLVVGGLGVFVGYLSVDSDCDLLSFDLDLVGEPFVVDMAWGFDIFEALDTASLMPVILGGVDLTFVSNRGSSFFLIGGVDKDAGIGAFGGFNFAFKFEILELGVAAFSVGEVGEGELSEEGGPGSGFIGAFPAMR